MRRVTIQPCYGRQYLQWSRHIIFNIPLLAHSYTTLHSFASTENWQCHSRNLSACGLAISQDQCGRTQTLLVPPSRPKTTWLQTSLGITANDDRISRTPETVLSLRVIRLFGWWGVYTVGVPTSRLCTEVEIGGVASSAISLYSLRNRAWKRD